MPSTVTITGTLGPDRDVTSAVYSNVKSITFDVEKDTIKIVYTSGGTDLTVYFDYFISTTVTYTISGNDATVTIS